jgi:hypothetical protein
MLSSGEREVIGFGVEDELELKIIHLLLLSLGLYYILCCHLVDTE